MAIITQTKENLEYLTSEGIGASHCFTTRLGGVSTGHLNSMNIGANRGDSPENVEENYRILAKALDFDPLNTVLTRQTHSDIVRLVTKNDHIGFDHRHYPECDALITNESGVALVVFTADCTPKDFSVKQKACAIAKMFAMQKAPSLWCWDGAFTREPIRDFCFSHHDMQERLWIYAIWIV